MSGSPGGVETAAPDLPGRAAWKLRRELSGQEAPEVSCDGV